MAKAKLSKLENELEESPTEVVPKKSETKAMNSPERVYPCWLYFKDGQGVIVKSSEEETALGRGWEDSPAAFGIETCPASKPE